MKIQHILDVHLTFTLANQGYEGTQKAFEKYLKNYFAGISEIYFPNNPASVLYHPSGFIRYTLCFHANHTQLRWLENFSTLTADHLRSKRIEGVVLLDHSFSTYSSKSLNSGINFPFKPSED